jgi:hypothetical protein
MWEDLLKQQQWQNYYNCNCKGGSRSFYNNKAFPGYEVRVNRSRGTFSILLKHHLMGPSDWLYNLQTKLIENEIFTATLQTEQPAKD